MLPVINNIKQKWKIWQESPSGKLVAKVFRYALMAVIIGYLIYQIIEIGWQNILASLPTTPWFYLLFIVLYFSLPISEQFIYRLSLKFPFWAGFRVFIEKKILNADVLGYSGEAYLYMWGKKNLEEEDKYIFNVIKDNNIISSFASTLLAILLLTIFVYVGQVNFLDFFNISETVLIVVSALAILAIGLGIYFRHYIISMDRNTAIKVFSIHSLRIILVYSLKIVQWALVLPLVPLHVWFVFLSIRIIVSRLPFMPSADLLFVSMSLEASKYMDISGAGIAGIMMATNFLTKTMSFILYTYFASRRT